jgi:3-methylcrotonyl-CoA carboxylase alpha subunit
MIRSLLIANRGEIACRIIRACRQMGVRAIAVYSDADADAQHVSLADDAVRIGPADATRSYLDVDAIIDAALTSGAESIHPGYGFLSERAVLPRACQAHGLVWVGPSIDAIERMGSKIEAKQIARQAGVRTAPGYEGSDQSSACLSAAAAEIGFPLLIKASAGGGGKGMRRVETASEFLSALDMARREAAASFGDDAVLLERFIVRPRHLEVQLAGDKHGGLIHLFDRECSIQRNYQKIIEEAPADHLSPDVREELLASALKLGRAIAYDSVGTVEFILDAHDADRPYFLEMNTRLQVEHPVSEMVTGIDLVMLQIRVAAGEPLPYVQDEITCNGVAIEARVAAEDPAEGFRPQIGPILAYHPPQGVAIRVDSGVAAGSEITPYYDPMIAKVIAHGADRAEAARRLSRALWDFVLLGPGSNIGFLGSIVDHPDFSRPLSTRFLIEAFPDGWRPQPPSTQMFAQAARAAVRVDAPIEPWSAQSGFRITAAAGRAGQSHVQVTLGEGTRRVILSPSGDRVDGELVGRRTPRVVVLAADQEVHLFDCGLAVSGRVRSELEVLAASTRATAARGGAQSAPMPGLVTRVCVAVGDRVEAGQDLAVMEAMKLVLTLSAEAAGRVSAVRCGAGETVRKGQVLVEIEVGDV